MSFLLVVVLMSAPSEKCSTRVMPSSLTQRVSVPSSFGAGISSLSGPPLAHGVSLFRLAVSSATSPIDMVYSRPCSA